MIHFILYSPGTYFTISKNNSFLFAYLRYLPNFEFSIIIEINKFCNESIVTSDTHTLFAISLEEQTAITKPLEVITQTSIRNSLIFYFPFPKYKNSIVNFLLCIFVTILKTRQSSNRHYNNYITLK